MESKDPVKDFTEEDAEALLAVGKHIENILPMNVEDAWKKWVRQHDVSCNSLLSGLMIY